MGSKANCGFKFIVRSSLQWTFKLTVGSSLLGVQVYWGFKFTVGSSLQWVQAYYCGFKFTGVHVYRGFKQASMFSSSEPVNFSAEFRNAQNQNCNNLRCNQLHKGL